MRRTLRVLSAAMAVLYSSVIAASAASVTVPKGTDVPLKFSQSVSSKTAKEGQTVKLTVARDVNVDGMQVVKAGTPVTGVISKVDKKGAYGKNATLRIALNPVQSTGGAKIPIDPRTKGKIAKSEKTDKAAAATAGGALVLGPIGLVGGYFVKGKAVEIKAGDPLETEVAKATTINTAVASDSE